MTKENNKPETKKEKLPKKYEKPTVSSEDLMAFAAACNGTNNGGRKSSIGDPHFCNSRKLNS